MIEFGFQKASSVSDNLGIVFGTDVKLYDENQFYPDIHGSY